MKIVVGLLRVVMALFFQVGLVTMAFSGELVPIYSVDMGDFYQNQREIISQINEKYDDHQSDLSEQSQEASVPVSRKDQSPSEVLSKKSSKISYCDCYNRDDTNNRSAENFTYDKDGVRIYRKKPYCRCLKRKDAQSSEAEGVNLSPSSNDSGSSSGEGSVINLGGSSSSGSGGGWGLTY